MAAEVDKWQRALRPEFTLFAAAREALLKFGGIRVEQDGPGEECARETFDLNPLHALGEADRFQSFESITPAKLCPLGEAGGGHAFLAISERGAIYALMEELWLVGDSIEEALEALVLGRRSRKAT